MKESILWIIDLPAVGEDLDSDEASLLGNTEGGASSSATGGESVKVNRPSAGENSRDVGAVAVAVSIGVATESLAPASTAAEVALLGR